MRILKLTKILLLTLALLSALSLQARAQAVQMPGQWSAYADAGISGFHGFRNIPDELTQHNIGPAINAGAGYLLLPYLRLGANLGYTKVSTVNTTNKCVTNIFEHYKVGSYDDGTLTQTIVDLNDINEANFLFAGVTAEFNFMEYFSSRMADRLGVWFGTGLGYVSGWNRHALTQAFSEVAVADGADHYNIFTHDYIASKVDPTHSNSMYIPFILSAEYFVYENLSISLGGYYRCIPLKVENTPKGLWAADFGIRYHFR